MNQTMKNGMVLIGAIAAIIGCLLCNFYVSFGYGGWTGYFAEFRSLPNDDELESLRGDAIKNLTQAHTELDTSLAGLTLYEKTSSDMCAKGSHNWKRSDDYAYICAYRLTYYYGTNREYKEFLLSLERTLADLGWKIGEQTPEQPTISETLREYSGDIYMLELPYYIRRKPDIPRITLAINSFDGYGVPWTISSDEPNPIGFGIGIGQVVHKNATDKSPKEIFKKIVDSGQKAIMIAISTEYFRN